MVRQGKPVGCYGLSPANYEGEAMPKLIEYSVIAMVVYGAMLVVFVTWDYFNRRSTRTVPAEKKSPIIQVLPLVLWALIFYILINAILINLVNMVMFYSLRAGTTPQEREMACYMVYYTKGGLNDIVYGNFGIVIIPPIILYILCAFAWMRPTVSINRAALEARLIELFPQAARAARGETIHMLHLGSGDGVEALSLAEAIEEGGHSSYAGRLKMTLSDKYGNGTGQNSIAEVIVTANIERRQLSEAINVVNIPAVVDKRSINVVELRQVPDESYDLVNIHHKLDWLALLDIWLEKDESYISMGRFVNCFVETRRVLRHDGVAFVTFEGDIKAASQYRKYLALAGFQSNVKVIAGLRRTVRLITPWGLYNTGVTYYRAPDTYFIAAQKAPDSGSECKFSSSISQEESRIRISSSSSSSSSSCVTTSSSSMTEVIEREMAMKASTEKEEPELTFTQWNLLWFLFVTISFSIYVAILAVTILRFDAFRFPTRAGFINYFAFMLIGVVQNTLISLTGGLILQRYAIERLPRITLSKVWKSGWTFFLWEYILGMIYSVPQWIVTVIVRYYAMGVVFGMDPNGFWSGLATAAVLAVLFLLFYKCFQSKVTLGVNEIPNLDLDFDERKPNTLCSPSEVIDVELVSAEYTHRHTYADLDTRKNVSLSRGSQGNPLVEKGEGRRILAGNVDNY